MSSLRLLSCFALAAVSGCQCFLPVEEVLDSGVLPDGGPGAGGAMDGGACLTAAECPGPFPACEAGQACCGSQCLSGQCVQVAIDCRDAGPAECASARDCTGPIATTRACALSGGRDAGFSCIQGQCIAECGDLAGRTCKWGVASLCLTCQQDVCVGDCPSAFVRGFTVEDITCGVGIAPWAPPTRFDVVRDPTSVVCDFGLESVREGNVGRVRFLDNGEVQADLPALGGLCVGAMLPTGALRIVLSCPRCQVMFMGG